MPSKNVAESSPSSPPFLVVAGAGYGAVNGRYAQEGVCEGRPKFKKLNGEFTVIFKWGQCLGVAAARSWLCCLLFQRSGGSTMFGFGALHESVNTSRF